VSVVLWCRRADGPHREVGADRAEVSRGRSTGRDRMGLGRTERQVRRRNRVCSCWSR
jgi:hypothetical protein